MRLSWRRVGVFLGLPVMLALCSCGAQTSGADAGDADGADGARDADGAGGDRQLLDGGTTLRVPAGTVLCEMNYESDFPEGIFPRLRITLRAGAVSLPAAAGETQMDWLDRVELGGAGQNAAATAAGRFSLNVQEDLQGNLTCQFDFRQPYRLGAESFIAGFGFWLECPEGGVLDFPADVTLLSPAWPCGSTAGNTVGRVRAAAENGDAVEFEYVYYDGCRTIPPGGGGICPAYMGSPLRAEFTRGQAKHVVSDYFRLGLACIHHGLPRYFIMVFEQPVGGAHALALDDLNESPAKLIYLGADFSPLSESTVSGITYE